MIDVGFDQSVLCIDRHGNRGDPAVLYGLLAALKMRNEKLHEEFVHKFMNLSINGYRTASVFYFKGLPPSQDLLGAVKAFFLSSQTSVTQSYAVDFREVFEESE
jgi:hypothetical protein